MIADNNAATADNAAITTTTILEAPVICSWNQSIFFLEVQHKKAKCPQKGQTNEM